MGREEYLSGSPRNTRRMGTGNSLGLCSARIYNGGMREWKWKKDPVINW